MYFNDFTRFQGYIPPGSTVICIITDNRPNFWIQHSTDLIWRNEDESWNSIQNSVTIKKHSEYLYQYVCWLYSHFISLSDCNWKSLCYKNDHSFMLNFFLSIPMLFLSICQNIQTTYFPTKCFSIYEFYF